MLVLRNDIKGKDVHMKQFQEAMESVMPSITEEIEKGYAAFVKRSSKRIAEEATKMHY